MKKIFVHVMIGSIFYMVAPSASAFSLKKTFRSVKKRVKKTVRSVEKRGKELEATVRNVRDGKLKDAAKNLTKFATKSTGIDASYKAAQDVAKTTEKAIRDIKKFIKKDEELKEEVIAQKTEVEVILEKTETKDIEVREIINELTTITKLNQSELVAIGVSRALAFISYQLASKGKYEQFLDYMGQENKESIDLNMYYFGMNGEVERDTLNECLSDISMNRYVRSNNQEKIFDRVDECFDESLVVDGGFSNPEEAQEVFNNLVSDRQAKKIYAVYEDKIRSEIETPVELIKTLNGVRLGFQEIREKGKKLTNEFERQIKDLDIKIVQKKKELSGYQN